MDALSRDQLAPLVDAEDVSTLGYEELRRLFEREPGLTDHLPDGICQLDPRSDEPVLFNRSRARRPHDNRAGARVPCIVCTGRLTRAVDVAALSQGFTFINKNLYPILQPRPGQAASSGQPAHGLHFLQWTSSHHDLDWHNMPLEDRLVVLGRLAALERTLLLGARGVMPDNRSWGDEQETAGYVGVIKNHGHLVGGSVDHGHQQIGLSSVMPRRFLENLRFERARGEKLSRFILRENPARLTLVDYGAAVLLVPYFMRRPFDMQLVLRDPDRRYLFQLAGDELEALARGLHDAIGAVRRLMPALGKEVAYNVVTHSGPGAGLYLELLPYTQETGGFEQLGLVSCQASPDEAARRLREAIAG